MRALLNLVISGLFAAQVFSQPAFQWEQRASLPAQGRWGAYTFEMDGYGYVAGGHDGSNYRRDVWRYDPNADTWQQMANMPGVRRHGTSWSINGKGYVTCGQSATSTFSDLLWEYDPGTDTWTEKEPLPAMARYGTHGFSINGLGYVGGGNYGTSSGPFLADMWRYDPTSDQWSQVAGIPSLARYGATSFSTVGKGYVYGGLNSSLEFTNQFWEYDPGSNTWVARNTITGPGRSWSMSMPLAYDAVVSGGAENGVSIYDSYRYDPVANGWTIIAAYPGLSGWSGASFVLNGRIFGGLGRTIYPTSGHHVDWWELVRSNDVSVQENKVIHGELKLYPNPSRAGDMIHLEMPDNMHHELLWMTIFDASGRKVASTSVTNGQLPGSENLVPGYYSVRIASDGRVYTGALLRCE